MVTAEQQENLEKIIVNRWIRPVFQPIISLRDGSVLGFEALSRVSQPGIFDHVEEMFQSAEDLGCIWILEQVCRRAILHEIHEQKKALDQYHANIFINVSPKVLHDEKFREGFAREYTKRYGIDTERIVFEVTGLRLCGSEPDLQSDTGLHQTG